MKRTTKNILALALILCVGIFCSCGAGIDGTTGSSTGGAIEDAFITEDNFD